MAKDAKGHGSEKRGGATPVQSENAPFVSRFAGKGVNYLEPNDPRGAGARARSEWGTDQTGPGSHTAAGVNKSGSVVPVTVSDADAAKALAGGGAKSAPVDTHPAHVIPPTPASGRTAQGSAAIHDSIGHGDRVTFRDRFGQERTGKAVMRGPAGWVLNMGGAHGTPAVPSADSITKVRKSRR